jgi:hypothetical protein
MASLKSFLYGVAPILKTTGAALYERQRVLVNLGALEATPGRGPGSGVPLTAENFAVILISLLATDNLSELDEEVVDLCNSRPDPMSAPTASASQWKAWGKPTFKTELGRVLNRQPSPAIVFAATAGGISPRLKELDEAVAIRISVARFRYGQIVYRRRFDDDRRPLNFALRGASPSGPIEITAEIGLKVLNQLQDLIRFALAAEQEEK